MENGNDFSSSLYGQLIEAIQQQNALLLKIAEQTDTKKHDEKVETKGTIEQILLEDPPKQRHNNQKDLQEVIPVDAKHSVHIEGLKELAPLERQLLRIEGMEPYVLVSVVIASESYGMITSRSVPTNDFLSIFLLGTSTISIFAGLYAAVVFSMCIMYAKTALGLDQEDSYYYFMENTAIDRFRGFKAYRISLLLFVLHVILIIVKDLPYPCNFIGSVVGAFAFGFGYYTFDNIIKIASPIFKGIVPGQRYQTKRRMEIEKRKLN